MEKILSAKPDFGRMLRALREFFEAAERPAALVGFDGYVDKLVRLKKSQVSESYYGTVREFADFIGFMGATSADIAVHRIYEKIGGNGPLLADALAEKGVAVDCIGAMGDPQLSPFYEPLSQKAALYSISEAASSYVIEFDDGKLMLGDAECFESITWEAVTKKLGAQTVVDLFKKARLVAFANWSGLPNAADLLSGICRDICPALQDGQTRTIFFDLADPSAKSPEQFVELFQALTALSGTFHTVVGLNPKETLLVYNQYFGRNEAAFHQEMVAELLEDFPAKELVVHAAGCAYAGMRGEVPICVEGRYLKKPVISVGAGDNFNSGYCLGKLCGLGPAECAYLGNLSAVLFMECGQAATLEQLLQAVSNEIKD